MVAVATALLVIVVVRNSIGEDVTAGAARQSGSCGSEYKRYYAGLEVAKLPLSVSDRQCTGAGDGRKAQDSTTYVYGDCAMGAGADDACVSPVQVQTTPLCQKRGSLYRTSSGKRLPSKRMTVRGVPAELFESEFDLTTLEIYTGRTTISVYGRGQEEVLLVASKLRQPVGANIPSVGETLREFVADPEMRPIALSPPDRRALRSRRAC